MYKQRAITTDQPLSLKHDVYCTSKLAYWRRCNPQALNICVNWLLLRIIPCVNDPSVQYGSCVVCACSVFILFLFCCFLLTQKFIVKRQCMHVTNADHGCIILSGSPISPWCLFSPMELLTWRIRQKNFLASGFTSGVCGPLNMLSSVTDIVPLAQPTYEKKTFLGFGKVLQRLNLHDLKIYNTKSND